MSQKQRNRVNLTLSDDLFGILSELSELSGKPKATIIHELLEELVPQLQVSIDLIKKLRSNQIQMTDAKKTFIDMLMDVGEVIHDAQGQVNLAIKEINNDESFDNVTNKRSSD